MNMQTCIADFGLKNKLIISERNDPKVKGNKYKYIRNFLYRFADVLVCQTNDAKEYFPRYIQKKSVIIMNPLKDNLPKPWTGDREKIIVNFCRLEKQKNLKLLIDSFEIVNKKHSDYKLYIYGEGTEKEKLQEYINNKKFENDIFIMPYKDNIHEIIKKYTMFVSTSDYEGLSNSMLESMAIGLPTICTDCPCGGAKMVIRNEENGILIPVGDKERTAKAIIDLIEDKEQQKKLSENSIKIKQKLNVEVIAKEWCKLLA